MLKKLLIKPIIEEQPIKKSKYKIGEVASKNLLVSQRDRNNIFNYGNYT